MKPKLFIGSSKESLSVAYAIQTGLTTTAEITVWDQGVFTLSTTVIESLIKILEQSDFGIFIFSPDDLVKLRKKTVNKVRDNVVFELGLFIGKLGRERSFIIVANETKISLPSDLSGVIYGTYDSNRSDNNLDAAVGPVCNQVRNEIKKLGLIKQETTAPEANIEINRKKEEKFNDPSQEIKQSERWVNAYFLEKDYQKAITLLEKEKASLKSEDELYSNDLFIVLSKNKLEPENTEKITQIYLKLILRTLSYIGITYANNIATKSI